MFIESISLNKDGYINAVSEQGKLLLSPDQCSTFGVEAQAEISEATFGELCYLSGRNQAILASVKMLAMRDLSRTELINKLFDKGFGEHSECAADEMERLGYLNDYKYTKLMLTKYAGKGYDFLRAAYEMNRLGIDRERCEEVWQQEGLGEILPSAEDYLNKLAKKGDPSDLKWLRKAANIMQRAGYSEEEIDFAIARIETLSGGYEE